MKSLLFPFLKLMCAVALVAAGIWYLHSEVLGYKRNICVQAELSEGHVCLSTVMKDWDGRVLWVDARSQDAFERSTTVDAGGVRRLGVGGQVLPLRNDLQGETLLAQAMPRFLEAEGLKIVVFCDKSCQSADEVAARLRSPDLGIEAPVYVLEGGWDALRRDERFLSK